MIAQEPTPRQIRIAIVFTVALQLAVLFAQVLTSEMRGYDFNAVYAAGQIVREGRGARLYDLAEQMRAEGAIIGQSGMSDMVHPITHPPFEALLLAPLASMSYARAYLAWGVINILAWTLFAYLVRPFAPVPHQTFQYLLLCFAFLPAWSTLVYGQTTLLLLLLYTLTYRSLKRQQEARAGAFLALGLFKFQLVLPFALICLIRRQWRFMAGFSAVALLLGGLSVAAFGLSGVLAYGLFLARLVNLPANPGFVAILPRFMPTLRGVLSVLLTGHIGAKWINGVVALLSAILILVTGIWSRRRDRLEGDTSLRLTFAAGLLVTLITAFHLYVYDLALLPLIFFLVIGCPQWSLKTSGRTFLNVSIAVLYFPPLYILLAEWNVRYLLFVPVCAFALALFGFLRQPVDNSLEASVAGTGGISASGKDA